MRDQRCKVCKLFAAYYCEICGHYICAQHKTIVETKNLGKIVVCKACSKKV